MHTFILTCGLALGLKSVILLPDAAAQDELVRLEGDGRLGPEVDEYRGISSA